MAQYEYTLGAAVERTKVKELDRTVEYTYDALYRLTGEKITAADKTVTEYTYAYDKVSNRILKTENGTKTTYTYNALNQLVKENDTVYKYDDAGNLVSTTSSGKSAAYTYNAENKLICATVNEAGKTVVEEYTYDYAGNRTSKTTGSETVKYLNDNSVLTNVIAELDVDDNELCYYTIGADLISQERNGKTSLYLYDGQGSVRGLIDENSKVTDTYNYDAFGNLLDKTGTTVNNYLYCGEQFDSATGLYYLRARYMNPATGTFITQDTYSGTIFDPTSLHKYLYANANPVMNVDPSGYFTLDELNASSTINSILDNSANMNSQFALKFFKNFMKKMAISTIGGLISVGDQLSAGVTDPDELAIAFRNGFLTGFTFSFASGKVAMAIGGLGVIGGFKGAVESFRDGNFWQGIYRLSWSVIGGAGLYKLHVNDKRVNISTESDANYLILEDEIIGRSIGAKAKNYDIMDLETGEHYELVEGSHLSNVKVFAGKGVKTSFRNAEKYANRYGGNPENWQHVKATAIINCNGDECSVEVHYVRCEGLGNFEFFIKRWLD